jgi:hypothetical protein
MLLRRNMKKKMTPEQWADKRALQRIERFGKEIERQAKCRERKADEKAKEALCQKTKNFPR